jgi:hypothetical protein
MDNINKLNNLLAQIDARIKQVDEAQVTEEGLGKSLAAATALTLSTIFSGPTKANTVSNKPSTEFSTKIEKNDPDFYSAVLGYVDKYSDNMMKSIDDIDGDVIKYIAVKKELMKYCEAKRDNQTPNKLSDSALKLLEFIGNSLKESKDIGEYVKVGKTIKHINEAQVTEEKMNEDGHMARTWHVSYSGAVDAALNFGKSQGYTYNNDDIEKSRLKSTKQDEGDSNIFKITLYKDGKKTDKTLEIQIHLNSNREKDPEEKYELNCYIG